MTEKRIQDDPKWQECKRILEDTSVSSSALIDGLSAMVDDLLKAVDVWGNSRNGKNTYSNGQNDGRTLAYADCICRIKLLLKTSI